jgi:hypothetical protein
MRVKCAADNGTFINDKKRASRREALFYILKEKVLWARKLNNPMVMAETPRAIVGYHSKTLIRKYIKK